ncbi:MAG: cell division protein ZapA [Muribaculaceae bacterium]|nr:cell division protein ZapA [Muribaculaceae bacterium]
MYLNIGEQRISLTVPFANQDFVREVEEKVDGLYRQWRITFPGKTNREILAMVAYQYASYYEELRRRQADALKEAEECLRLIDTDLSATDAEEASKADYIPDFTDR